MLYLDSPYYARLPMVHPTVGRWVYGYDIIIGVKFGVARFDR